MGMPVSAPQAPTMGAAHEHMHAQHAHATTHQDARHAGLCCIGRTAPHHELAHEHTQAQQAHATTHQYAWHAGL
eukprot:574077-Pelagomonas_calceolata.AAC.2